MTAAADAAPEYSVRDFLTVLFHRKRIILTFAVTVFVVATLASFLMSPVYETRATILVKKSQAEVPLVPTESSQLIISQLTEEDLNSEIEILKSRQLVEEVLEALGVDESWRKKNLVGDALRGLRQILGAAKLSYSEELMLHLQKELEISAVRRSNVIQVSYRSTDPEWATRIVQTLTEHYLEHRTRVYQSPNAVSFFEEQMQEAEERLRRDEQALARFLDESALTMVKSPLGTDPLSAHKQLVLQQLGRFQNELADAQVAVRGQERTVASFEDRLASEPERLASANRFNQDATTEELERGLVALELHRDALLQDFTPNNRKVRDIDAQIELAEERLRQAQEQVGSINRTEINPVHQELKAQFLRAEAELEGERARSTSLQNQIAKFSQELEELNEKAFALETLRRDAQTAEEAYLIYGKKHEEARISSAMDENKIINVSIAQPAAKPLKPVAPKKTLNMILAVFLGVFGGLGLAFLTEYFDHTFTTGEDIERRLGIPHLASIPEEG